jgi:hypothetical protein
VGLLGLLELRFSVKLLVFIHCLKELNFVVGFDLVVLDHRLPHVVTLNLVVLDHRLPLVVTLNHVVLDDYRLLTNDNPKSKVIPQWKTNKKKKFISLILKYC